MNVYVDLTVTVTDYLNLLRAVHLCRVPIQLQNAAGSFYRHVVLPLLSDKLGGLTFLVSDVMIELLKLT
jgi:hypothetical protein